MFSKKWQKLKKKKPTLYSRANTCTHTHSSEATKSRMEFGFYIRQNCRFLLELKLQNALANYKTTKKELVSTAHEEKKNIFVFFFSFACVCDYTVFIR